MNAILFELIVYVKMMFWMCFWFPWYRSDISMLLNLYKINIKKWYSFWSNLAYAVHVNLHTNVEAAILWGMFSAIIWKLFTLGFHLTLYCPVSENYLCLCLQQQVLNGIVQFNFSIFADALRDITHICPTSFHYHLLNSLCWRVLLLVLFQVVKG